MKKSLYEHLNEIGGSELSEQWDQEKNGSLTMKDISYSSHKKVWWRCENGHSWQAVVYSRTDGGAGCPFCAKRKRIETGCPFLQVNPELENEWNREKNVLINPHELTAYSHAKVWWKCSKGHEWQAQVKSRVNGAGCPVCAGRKVLKGENDLATLNPSLSAEWHPQKNGVLTPDTVLPGSHRKVWWRCSFGHEWQAAIYSRDLGSGCPVCAGKLVVQGENDLASVFSDIAAEWHPTKNGELSPQSVTPYSNRSVWWICPLGHEYHAQIAHRTQVRSGCPYCAGKKVLAGFNDLATREPLVALQWHEELNGSLTPEMVTAGCHKKVWWQCSDGHVWKAVIASRTGSQRCGCPVCAGKMKKKRYKI